jgi:hypothetical protein
MTAGISRREVIMRGAYTESGSMRSRPSLGSGCPAMPMRRRHATARSSAFEDDEVRGIARFTDVHETLERP